MMREQTLSLSPSANRYTATRTDSKPWRKFAKILCHLREDVSLPANHLPDHSTLYYLAKRHYLDEFEQMVWEEVTYRLLLTFEKEFENQDQTSPWLAFFKAAQNQLRKATFSSHIWVH